MARVGDLTLDELVDFVQHAVTAALDQALAVTRRPEIITGTVAAIDGADVDVIPDDDPDGLIPGTLYAPGVAVGDNVIVLQFPPSGSFVLGPQA